MKGTDVQYKGNGSWEQGEASGSWGDLGEHRLLVVLKLSLDSSVGFKQKERYAKGATGRGYALSGDIEPKAFSPWRVGFTQWQEVQFEGWDGSPVMVIECPARAECSSSKQQGAKEVFRRENWAVSIY